MHRLVRLVAMVAVVGLPALAHAAPLATATADLDGDGTLDTLGLGADGVLRISGGKRAGVVTLGPRASAGRIQVGQRDGKPVIVVEVSDGAARSGVILVASGAARAPWREALRFPLGGVGLDADYSMEITASAEGVYRFQARAGMRRCDGKPALLFPEVFDGAQFRRPTRLPSGVPEAAPVLTAKLDPTTATPMVYRARLASHQPGTTDAGGLGTPTELDDGAAQTQWHEELAGSAGEGQFFTFEPRVGTARARQLRVVPGNPSTAATLKASNRPHRLAVVSAQGAWRIDLPDAANDPLGSAYAVELPDAIAGCVTVVLESSYGPATGQTAIAELEVFADGERAGGGDAMLAATVAADKDGALAAAQALAGHGAAGVAALEAELAKATDARVRRRVIVALGRNHDPAVRPALARAALEGWVSGRDLRDVIEALAAAGASTELAELAASDKVDLEARIAATGHLALDPAHLPLLLDLAGHGHRELRRAVIDRLTQAPLDAVIERAAAASRPAESGDLWRAVTRHARAVPAERPAARAALVAALPAAADYERRYRLIDGIGAVGDAAALTSLEVLLRSLPAGAETSALRQVALRAVAAAPREEALALVLGMVADPDPGVRLAVLAALDTANTDTATPWHTPDGPDGIDRVFVTMLTTDRWPELRRRAATGLGARCQRPGPALALTDAVTKDDSLDVRRDALTSLVECKAPRIAELLVATWSADKAPVELRTHAVGLAVALGDPALGIRLVSAFGRWRGAAIESAAAVALAQSAAATIALLHSPGAAEALTAALDDSAFPEIVSSAAQALGALGPACTPAAKAKLEVLARSDDQAASVARAAAARCGR